MHEALEALLEQLREMTQREMLAHQTEAESERDAAEIILQQARDRLEADLGLNGRASDETLTALEQARWDAQYWTVRLWMLRAARARN